MTQVNAILKYIEAKYHEANLGVAKDLFSQFELDEALAFLTGDYHPAFWPFFSPDRYTTNTDKSAQEDVRNAAYLRIDRVVSHLNNLLDGRLHVVGNKRTIADPYAFAMTRWTTYTPKPWQNYPSVKRFMEAILKDASVQATMKAEGLS